MSRVLILMLVAVVLLGMACPAFADAGADVPPAAGNGPGEEEGKPVDGASGSDPSPEPELELEPELEPEPELDSELDPEPDPEPELDPDPELDPEPEPEPEPMMMAFSASLLAAEVPPVVVYDEAELAAWLQNHTEGTVTLGNSITISEATISLKTGSSLVIDTGSFGLVFDGFYIYANNYTTLSITGQGVDPPVLTIKSMGDFRTGNWNNYLCHLNFTATGRDGQGGTALSIDYDRDIFTTAFQLSWPQDGLVPGKICSYGEGAVGIEFNDPSGDGDVNLYCFDVEVEGKNSVAVSAPQGVNLAFCKLSATGEGAQTLDAGGVSVVDTCIASPASTGKNTTVYQGSCVDVWFPLKQGCDAGALEEALWRHSSASLVDNSAKTLGSVVSITWDSVACAGIDLNTPGSTRVEGTISSPWFAEFFDATPRLFIEIRKPEIPCIYEAGALSETIADGVRAITGVRLYFWACDEWGQEDCALLRSADGGKSWQDITGDQGVVFEETNSRQGPYRTFDIPISMVDEDVWFIVEAKGFGESNPAHYSSDHPVQLPGSGGDRVGTDRLGVSLGGTKPVPSEDDDDTGGAPVGGDKPSGGSGSGDDDDDGYAQDRGEIWTEFKSGPEGDPPPGGVSGIREVQLVPPEAIAAAPLPSATPEPIPGAQGGTAAEAQPPLPAQHDAAEIPAAPAPAPAPASELPAAAIAPQPEPVTQPELPEPGLGVGAAIGITSAVTAAAGGGWLWLTKLRGIRK